MSKSGQHRIRGIYEAFVAREGRLPTAAQIAEEAHVGVKYARECLRLEKCKCERSNNVNVEGARSLREQRREARDAAFRDRHASMTRMLGRYPTAVEMALAMDYKMPKTARTICARLSLPYTRERIRTEKKEAPKPKAEPVPFVIREREAPVKTKIVDLRMSGDPGRRPEKIVQAGMGYGPQDRIFITCPVCGSRKLIAPRMHPHYLRNRAGELIWVCSGACTGGSVLWTF